MAVSAFIEVTDRGFTGTAVQMNPNIPKTTEFSSHNIQTSKSGALVMAGGIQLAKKAGNAYISRIGQRTGNRQQQNEINNVMKTFGFIGTVAQGGMAGFSVGGAGGAVAGAGIAAAMVGFNVGIAQQDYQIETEIESMSRAYQRSFSLAINNNNRRGGNA